jgi:ferric-dicitrate binding protein FerR (iron transport regulator)
MEKTDKKYSDFSFEDFLQDDFFITSMNNPTSETFTYWEKFRNSNPENRAAFNAAKEYLESLHYYYTTLSANEVEKMKQEFLLKKNKPKISIKKTIHSRIGVVAACIALILILTLYIKTKKQGDNNDSILLTVLNEKSDSLNQEVQLILSDHKTIVLSQKESIITYDTTGININQDERISSNESSSYNQLIVPFGKRSVLNLSDGSKVWVNSDSRLRYPVTFNNIKREISVDGEIYIEVIPDEKRPFIIKTKDLDIWVLGTKFNVTAYEKDSEKRVVLVSGSIRIKSMEKEMTLTPNQMYTYKNKQSQIDFVNTEKYTSWIKGIYYCENESLSSIFQRLSRYFGIIIIPDAKISPVIFSGKLDLKENLPEILDGISFIIPITYKEIDGVYIISEIE